MSSSRAFTISVSSVSLVFGLDWFAILGGRITHEVRRISRQNKATHVVQSSDEAASVGVGSLRAHGQRGKVLYSAAQLVAQRFSTGTVAMVAKLDNERWWLVAVHDGAVIARTDYVYATPAETSDLIRQLYQAYPALTLLADDTQPALSDLVSAVCMEAQLKRISYRTDFLPRPVQWFVLLMIVIILISKVTPLLDFSNYEGRSGAQSMTPDAAWQAAIQTAMDSRWVHGVSGTRDLLDVMYGLPVVLADWWLSHVECTASHSRWQCHADYDRSIPEASNEQFLSVAHKNWSVSFTPLEKARVRWDQLSKGVSASHAVLKKTSDNERDLFSRLQAIRPALAQVSIAAPKPLPVNAPINEQGHPVPRPSGLPTFGLREMQIKAPLRSVSLLLPYCDAITWNKITINLEHRAVPALTTSRLNTTLQGVLHEKN